MIAVIAASRIVDFFIDVLLFCDFVFFNRKGRYEGAKGAKLA